MKKTFYIEGMTCASCVNHVDKSVRKVKGVEDVNVSLLTNSMEVDYSCDDKDIITAVDNAGYKAFLNKTKEKKDHSLRNLIIAFVFLILLMYVSMGHMVGLPLPPFLSGHENALYFSLAQLILTLPIVIIYHHFFVTGFKRLFKLSPNMDSLIAIGATASLVYGVFAIIMIGIGLANNNHELVMTYHESLYFESAAMILTLVSFGKYLENKSKKRTTLAITKLMDLAPKKATLFINNEEKVVPLEEVKKGDILVIKKGEQVPVDGKIIYGTASIDQSNITGESLPVVKNVNDRVFSSTIISSGYIKIEAEKVGEDTSIANIIRLVKEASDSKAPISKLVDKVSGIFVPVVIGISILTLIIHLIISKNFESSFNYAISVLVVACPCALGLATPVAIMVGTGKGAQCGLLIKNAEILEKAQYIKTIVLDKTGTLTEGKPKVTDVVSQDDNLLDIAYSLEYYSEHPLSNAITSYCESKNVKLLNVSNFTSLEGKGLKGMINEEYYSAGNLKLIKELKLDNEELIQLYDKLSFECKTPLIFTSSKKILGIIAVSDMLKSSSKEAIQELKKLGIETIMLTGDNKNIASLVAKQVGIDKVYAEVFPEDKQQVIKSLKKDSHHLVSMVGDGVNDALALTNADLGISIGGGSDIAKESSDIVLLRNDLEDVKNIILLSKRVFLTIKVNLFWAFFYNCIGIILATGLLEPWLHIKLNPMLSSLMMSISSVFVVVNALTINLLKIGKKENKKMKNIVLNVEGMMCNHCKKHVEDALKSVGGVTKVEVSLEKKNAIIECNDYVDVDTLIEAVNKEGYSCKK